MIFDFSEPQHGIGLFDYESTAGPLPIRGCVHPASRVAYTIEAESRVVTELEVGSIALSSVTTGSEAC